MDIRGLGYIGIGAADVDAWRRYGQLLGAMVDDDGDGVRLRIDERPCRVFVDPGADELAFAGWELPDAAAVALAAHELDAAGYDVSTAPPEVCARHRVAGMITTTDPSGFALELFHGPVLDHRRFVSPAGVSGFRTGSLGMGHIVLGSTDVERSVAFYTDLLGFRVSDIWRPDGHDVVFLRCNQRHHSLALAPADAPALYHFMFEAQTLDDVGDTLDRHLDAAVPISAGLGKHTNDYMVSFYSRSPSGFDVEFGCGGRLVDDADWIVTEITAPSFWGHRPPAA